MQQPQLIGLSLVEIESLVTSYGYNISLAQNICKWIYRRECKSFYQMDDIPKGLREKLSSDDELFRIHPFEVQYSCDGTQKYLYKTPNGNPFEVAYIPGAKRNTLCISTQSGCKMECSFCYTGTIGFRENLTATDIVLQLLSNPNLLKINRIVLMGMGEPLDNIEEVINALKILTASWGMAFGASNITLSTIGILPNMLKLIHLRMCNIAISLHSPFAAQRHEMMPVEKDYPIEMVVDFFRMNPLKKPLRLSFEYIVIPGENDSVEHAAATAALLKGLSCHVNVIPLNNSKENSENLLAAKKFQRMLNDLNQPTTLRFSRGIDIDAACGMMAGKELKK